jgi:hypothetical protein
MFGGDLGLIYPVRAYPDIRVKDHMRVWIYEPKG